MSLYARLGDVRRATGWLNEIVAVGLPLERKHLNKILSSIENSDTEEPRTLLRLADLVWDSFDDNAKPRYVGRDYVAYIGAIAKNGCPPDKIVGLLEKICSSKEPVPITTPVWTLIVDKLTKHNVMVELLSSLFLPLEHI